MDERRIKIYSVSERMPEHKRLYYVLRQYNRDIKYKMYRALIKDDGLHWVSDFVENTRSTPEDRYFGVIYEENKLGLESEGCEGCLNFTDGWCDALGREECLSRPLTEPEAKDE